MIHSSKVNLRELWVDNDYDLSRHSHCKSVGKISVEALNQEVETDLLIRPRRPVNLSQGKTLPASLPAPLHELFNIACRDLRQNGLNHADYSVYPLYQTGMVDPDDCLRAGFWHFDLMRNLRLPVPEGKMAFSLGYSVTNTLPTIFATQIKDSGGASLPARDTIENEKLHNEFGERALCHKMVTSPLPGEVIRYDSMTLHRGRPNTGNSPVHRVFMNLSFCRN